MSHSVSFILPYKPKRPTGGVKMMYEYANRLAKEGYRVHIYYSLRTRFIRYRFPFPVRWALAKIEGFRTYRWFAFEPQVTMSYITRVEDRQIADADIIVATWWSTAMDMGKLSHSKGKKINLIQGFENWEGAEDMLYESYRMPGVTHIVIASFLKKIVDRYAPCPSIIIENAIDVDFYRPNIEIAVRNPRSICMCYHTQNIKRCEYGLEALKMVKEKIPNLQAEMFSIFPKPADLPAWIHFEQTPADLPAVYNRNAIFISNSETEGFGLVSVEAMACGCALVCTDIPGHREFAIDRQTALLVPPLDSREMAEKIIELVENSDLRIHLAQNGVEFVQKYSWQSAMKKFLSVIESLLSEK